MKTFRILDMNTMREFGTIEAVDICMAMAMLRNVIANNPQLIVVLKGAVRGEVQ
jgi:hypothetical protein